MTYKGGFIYKHVRIRVSLHVHQKSTEQITRSHFFLILDLNITPLFPNTVALHLNDASL